MQCPPLQVAQQTALHVASRCGKADVVQVLVECKANLEAMDEVAVSPVQCVDRLSVGVRVLARGMQGCGGSRE